MSAAVSTPVQTVDLGAIKTKQQATWASGDYAVVGGTLAIAAEALCEAADLRAGQRVLDVATGSGNAAIAAARRWCDVTGIDYVPALLARARERAAAERLPCLFQDGDAEAIPFPDASFDALLSTYGMMFAPDHARTAREALRVVKSGGVIAMANWTPEGFLGQIFRVLASHVPPTPGLQSPMLWGTEAHLRLLFGDAISTLDIQRKHFNFRYRSAAHYIEVFRTVYGPILKTFAALDATRQEALTRDLTQVLESLNIGGTGSLVVPAEYLEVIARKR